MFAASRSNLAEITDVLITNNIHILAITEIHLGYTFSDNVVNKHGYDVYRKDRRLHRGRVAIYIQSHIPVKMRQYRMPVGVEALWLQVQFL